MIENTWIFPALEALHVIGLALLVGSIALADFQVLGWTAARAPEHLTRDGLWLMVLTGVPMFLSGYERYRQNPAFLAKMCVLAVALVLHYTIHKRAMRSTHKRAMRSTAFLSLAMWTAVVIAARAVIDFDV